jgi:Domain of unknown function (DUF4426)
MMKTITTMALVSLALLGLAACDAPTGKGSTGEGRTRLSATDGYSEIGEYVVHVNGMTATALTPEIAQAYGIVRSENRGIVNLAVMRKGSDGGMNTPVSADVEVSAANLTGQLKPVRLQEILEGDAIYYVGEVSIDDREMINFDLDVRPEGDTRVLKLRFSHQFYTE